MNFKTSTGKNQHLLRKLIFENWPKCAFVGCTQKIWGNQNISFLYAIEINLFKDVLWDKMWSRTIGELNLNETMPKILKLQKL